MASARISLSRSRAQDGPTRSVMRRRGMSSAWSMARSSTPPLRTSHQVASVTWETRRAQATGAVQIVVLAEINDQEVAMEGEARIESAPSGLDRCLLAGQIVVRHKQEAPAVGPHQGCRGRHDPRQVRRAVRAEHHRLGPGQGGGEGVDHALGDDDLYVRTDQADVTDQRSV